MKKIKYFFNCLGAILVVIVYFSIYPQTVSAACSTPSLSVRNTYDDFTYPENSPIVIEGSSYQTDEIYAVASTSGCSSPQFDFILEYWNGSSYVKSGTDGESGWST